ncbi:hypothetical protein, partial [Spirosoma areae]
KMLAGEEGFQPNQTRVKRSGATSTRLAILLLHQPLLALGGRFMQYFHFGVSADRQRVPKVGGGPLGQFRVTGRTPREGELSFAFPDCGRQANRLES